MAEFLPVEPFQIVIFGGTGDLSRRKLLPALFHRFLDGQISEACRIIGAARSELDQAAFVEMALKACKTATSSENWDPKKWKIFASLLDYQQIDISDAKKAWKELGAKVDFSEMPVIYYLAMPPSLYAPICQALKKADMVCPSCRVVLEKPIGRDLASAQEINDGVCAVFQEDQIYRIDHYLGKETVQNLIALRFQNAIFEPLWNRKHVESVEISVCETVAMEGRRGAYYDTAGALRDMVQNHLMQVLTLVAMEPPASMHADDVRNEKVKVVRSLRQFSTDEVLTHTVRAQYAGSDTSPEGYRDAYGVAPDSTTESYVAIRALVDNWRWSGVPFLLRTGKALHQRFTEVVLRFRTPPIDLLNGPTPTDACALRPNTLRLLIQPDEGVRLSFQVKQPGQGMVMRHAELGFDYSELETGDSPPAYQRLLTDALDGNATLFLRGDEVEAAWAFVDAIRAGWHAAEAPVATYPRGSTGPEEADDLFHGCEGTWSYGP